jgi:hypothetical protein
MSLTFKRNLPVDFIIGIDPGYATQGINVFDCRHPVPKLLMSKATVTDSESDIWYRVEWQFQRIRDVLAWLGQHGNVPLNCLLVLEEYRVAGGQKTSPAVIYNRAFYDALFRERMARFFRFAITVHPMIVRLFSGLTEKQVVTDQKTNKPKTKNVPHSIYDGSIAGVLKYILHVWPELLHPSVAVEASEFHQVEWLGKKPARPGTKGSWVAHVGDAMVMSLIGMTAFIYPGMMERWNESQRGKIKSLEETYDFQEEINRTFR